MIISDLDYLQDAYNTSSIEGASSSICSSELIVVNGKVVKDEKRGRCSNTNNSSISDSLASIDKTVTGLLSKIIFLN